MNEHLEHEDLEHEHLEHEDLEHEDLEHDCGRTVFRHARGRGLEGIVSSGWDRVTGLGVLQTGSSPRTPRRPR
jgi:hypothetical protein